MGEDYERWLEAHEPSDPGGRGEAGDVIVQMYTSGTTGVPKGVLTTHGNLAVTAQTSLRWAFDERSVSLTPLPMFHIGGIGWAYCGLWHGATTVLVSDFDAAKVLDVLEHQRVTNAVLVPTMLQMLTAVPGAAERDYSALRSIAYGAAPITTPVLKASLRTFGCALFGLYGLTETTGGVIALEPEDHDPGGPREHLLRSAGRPYPWVELKIVDPVSAEALPPRSVGEVWLRGPNVTRGYFNRPAETAAALTPDGWLRTGDGGYVDEEGYLFLTDRIKDMIVSGGENVYPGRGGGGARSARRRRRRGGHRRARRALGRGGQGADRPAARRGAGSGGPDRVRARAARRLQAAAFGRVRRRVPAHAQRQGAQARAAPSPCCMN